MKNINFEIEIDNIVDYENEFKIYYGKNFKFLGTYQNKKILAKEGDNLLILDLDFISEDLKEKTLNSIFNYNIKFMEDNTGTVGGILILYLDNVEINKLEEKDKFRKIAESLLIKFENLEVFTIKVKNIANLKFYKKVLFLNENYFEIDKYEVLQYKEEIKK